MFRRLQCRFDHARDGRGDVVLKLEDIFERAIEPVGPEMGAGDRIKQLRGYADAVSGGLANRAFQHVQDPKFSADLLHVHRPTLVGEARVSSDYKEPVNARQGGDDLFDHAIGKIALLWVTTQILERQYCDGWLLWER